MNKQNEVAQRVSNVRVIGFLTALLLFTANHTHKDRDLLDSIMDYVDSKTYVNTQTTQTTITR